MCRLKQREGKRWKGYARMFMIFFKLLTGNLFGVKEENNENLSQYSLSSDRDSYLKYTKQESQRLHYDTGLSTIQVNIYAQRTAEASFLSRNDSCSAYEEIYHL
jgi:hypothetical protein